MSRGNAKIENQPNPNRACRVLVVLQVYTDAKVC